MWSSVDRMMCILGSIPGKTLRKFAYKIVPWYLVEYIVWPRIRCLSALTAAVSRERTNQATIWASALQGNSALLRYGMMCTAPVNLFTVPELL